MLSSPSTEPRCAADVLSRDEIRALTRPSNLRGLLAILSTWLVIAAAFAVLARFPHPAVFVLVTIVLGGRQLALAILMHEAAHRTLFRGRFSNDVLTDFLCARPVWTDVARYRKHHLRHHAHTGTERDPDLGLAAPFPTTRRSLARKVLRDLTGISGIRRTLGLLAIDLELVGYDVGGGAKRLPRRSFWHHARAGLRNLTPPLFANAFLAGILYLTGKGWLFSAWVAAFFTTYGLFLRIRSIAEHGGLVGTNPFLNTRTTYAGIAARWTVAPLNVGFHLEHHLLPSVPFHRLPEMHRLLCGRGKLPSPARGYLDVLRSVANAETK
jgi:fatty acid desaturase